VRTGSSAGRFEKEPSLQRCRLIVDGYNLLFELGWIPNALPRPDDSPVTLQECRNRLASEIASRLPEAMVGKSLIVYDSSESPKGLPVRQMLRGIHIGFSVQYNSADEAIQEILQYHPTPKRLVVISSDHAVQRKAKARGAQCFDSEHWEKALEHLQVQAGKSGGTVGKPPVDPDDAFKSQSLAEGEQAEWLRKFGF